MSMATIALIRLDDYLRDAAAAAVRHDSGLGFFKGLSFGLALSVVFWVAVGNIVWSALA